MTDCTPDTLKAFADEPRHKLGERTRKWVYAHADAWEAQMTEAIEANSEIASAHWELCKRLEAAKEQADVDRSFIEQYQVEVAGLRQRLEAAEKKPVEDDGAYWRTGWPLPAAGEVKP